MRPLLPIGLSLACVLLLMACFGDAPNSGTDPESGLLPADTIHRADSSHTQDTLRLDSNWSESASAAAGGSIIVSVSQSESLFVAVGENGAIVRSSDGAIWRGINSGTSEDLAGVILGGTESEERFVAVGENGTLLVSADGTAWVQVEEAQRLLGRSPYSDPYPDWTGVAWNGSFFLAIGYASIIEGHNTPATQTAVLISQDGIHWTLRLISLRTATSSLVWDPALAGGEGRFVAEIPRFSQGVLYFAPLYSTDGLTWTNSP